MKNSSGPARDAGNRQRVTVSLDADIVSRLKNAAEQSDARSVSAYVEHLLRKDDWLRRWKAAVGEPDPAALGRARNTLLAELAATQPRAS